MHFAQPPLYLLEVSGKEAHEYAYSDRERDALVEAGHEGRSAKEPWRGLHPTVQGSWRDERQRVVETTMDPDRRILLQVTPRIAAQADEVFSMLMGEDVESRRASSSSATQKTSASSTSKDPQ
ncbi:MAG: hypothetical protein U0R27_02270 [Candidatus Nanopelagicales bacterium]